MRTIVCGLLDRYGPNRDYPRNSLYNLGYLKMKKLVLGAAFALVATSAVAGSVAPPIIEDTVIIEQAATSSVNHHILPPLLFVLAVGASMALL